MPLYDTRTRPILPVFSLVRQTRRTSSRPVTLRRLRALTVPALREGFAKTGVEVPEGENPARFQGFIAAGIARYLKLAAEGYLKAE